MIEVAPPQVVIGTSGHVDHGKSALVQALTGTDPDRLPEERARGMTIDLGFAFRPVDAGLCLAFVDCPGHERFVRRMVAGTGAVDGALLVVAADEGISAQTVEHAQVLRLLDLAWAGVVVSKADCAMPQRCAAVGAQARALLGESLPASHPLACVPSWVVSAHNGQGLDALLTWLVEQARKRLSAVAAGPVRLAIDRCFQRPGHGLVVAGSLRGAPLELGAAVVLQPGGAARIRGLHVAGQAVRRALPGQRVAATLAGLSGVQAQRGCWLAEPDLLEASRALILAVNLSRPLRDGASLGLLHGAARVQALALGGPGGTPAGQSELRLRLAAPLFPVLGDRVLLSAGGRIIGGGRVLDPRPPPRRRRTEVLPAAADPLLAHLCACGAGGAHLDGLRRWAGGEAILADLRRHSGTAVAERGGRLVALECWQEAGLRVRQALRALALADPLRCWFTPAQMRRHLGPMDEALLRDLVAEWPDLHEHQGRFSAGAAPLSSRLVTEVEAVLTLWREAGLRPPYDWPLCDARPDPQLARRAVQAAEERGLLLAISDRQHLERGVAETIAADLRRVAAAGDGVDVQWLKAELGLSRKYAIPVLEWCDRCGLTKRVGDRRFPGPNSELMPPVLSTWS